MDGFPWRLVTFDIDGTLTLGHGWLHIATALDRLPAYRATNERYRNQEIGEDEQLRNLLDLATGVSPAELERALESTPKVASIREVIEALHRRGAQVALLTHNPGYVCRWYAHRYGFDDFEGTIGPEPVDGRFPPPGPVRADKIAGLDNLLSRWGIDRRRTLHAGDSYADAEVFPKVGGGIALNSRIPEVRAAADAVADLDDLIELLPILDRLQPRP